MISILIPVYNEEGIIGSTLERLHSYLSSKSLQHEIIVASNGSTDKTVEIVEALAQSQAHIKLVKIEQRSVGLAFSQAAQAAKGDLLISLDADLSSELTFIDYAVSLFPFYDMLVGSKTMGTQRRNPVRVIGSQIYILFTQLFFDLTISDYSLGSKAYRREAILPALSHIDSWTGYVFEVCLYLKLRGKRVLQVGVDCDDKRKSRFNLWHEGFYRYLHLFKQYRRLKDESCWLNPKK